MKKLIIIACSMASFSAFAGGHPGSAEAQNQAVWEKYCVGKANSADTPVINYKNPLVRGAAVKLSQVADLSFYFYADVKRQYGVDPKKDMPVPADLPKGTTKSAHAFLVILCGEFRDRATMVEAKLQWVNNLFLLPTSDQKPINPKANIWSQLSAHSYSKYLKLSDQLFNLRAKDAKAAGPLTFGSERADRPVSGQLVCETKFLISEYAAKGLDKMDIASAKEFTKASRDWGQSNCSDEDWDYYYDFRGDSNFKPNSPESNGMIWHSQIIGKNCASPTKAIPNGPLKSTDCKEYFTSPFLSRWNAARAGLGVWLLHDAKSDPVFNNANQGVTIIPSLDSFSGPYQYIVEGSKTATKKLLSDWSADEWTQPDMGFNSVSGLGGKKADLEFSYLRLRNALNRHTNWYASKYDGFGKTATEAYSPLVASSYEMSKSDGFTSPGTTVQSPTDGKKHWMYVFRIHKDNWYNTQSLADGKEVNFDSMWFDETSLGTDGLAKSERAWDRLGTALEGEMDSILYLHNITSSGQVATK